MKIDISILYSWCRFLVVLVMCCCPVKGSSCVFRAAGFLRCRPLSDRQSSRCHEFGYFPGTNLNLRKANSMFIYCREEGATVCVCTCGAMETPVQMLLGICKYSNITNVLNMKFLRKASSDLLGAAGKRPRGGAGSGHPPGPPGVPTPATPWAYSRSPNHTGLPIISYSRHNSVHSRGVVLLSVIRGSGVEFRVHKERLLNRTRLAFDPSPVTGSVVAVLVSLVMIVLVGIGLALY